MPELPEVETIRRELAPRVTGRLIVGASSHPAANFRAARRASGRIERVDRRGKYLLLDLVDHYDDRPGPARGRAARPPRELVIHLGMTGSLGVHAQPSGDPYVRASWVLDDGTRLEHLELRDPRRFGRVALVRAGDHSSLATLAALGPEPLADDFDPLAFHAALRRSTQRIKTQLLSQRPVAGVGNIYADEALWLARIHPASRRVTRPQAIRLHAALRDVLTAALDDRGTTLRDYRTPGGAAGEHRDRLACYGRAGQPCPRCGTTLRRAVLDGRGTTWCPECQPRR